MSSVHRGRRTWAVPLLLVLAVVIVSALAFNLANLDPGRETIPGDRVVPGRSEVGVIIPHPIAVAALWLLGILILVGIVALFLRRPRRARRPVKPMSWWNLLASVIGLLVVIAVLVAMPRPNPSAANETASANGTASGAVLSPWAFASGWPIEVFVLVAVFASLVWILYRTRAGAASIPADGPVRPDFSAFRRAAAEAIQVAVHDLEIGEDVRAAILACFQRFGRLLGSRGFADQAALTPRELERIAVRSLAASPEASETLTSLFEEARYSEHELGEADRRRAIESLTRIQAALEA